MTWIILPRGTLRAYLNPFAIDVFYCALHPSGWRYNILNTQTGEYAASQSGYSTSKQCKEDAENCARLLLHPIKHGL